VSGILTRARFHILLLSVLLIEGPVSSGCAPVTRREVETMAPEHASTRIAERGATTWDLVALGDSTPTGYGVGADHSYVQVYAGYIEEDLGVEVAVHNWATDTTRTVADWVEVVRNSKELREDLLNAEVITVWLGWHDVIPSIGVGRGGPCYLRADQIDLDCLREVTDPMQEGFERLLSEIVSLASPAQTLILIADVGIPSRLVASWKEDGPLELMKGQAYEVWRDYLLRAASEHKVHVVHTYEVLNGPTGDQEIPPEYMQSDGLHFNEEGHKLLAEIHRNIGYEYSSP
jgi:lysophospholipase L1-like esterase